MDGNEFLVDASVVAESLGVKIEQIERFLRIFVDSAKQDLAALENAVAAPDFQTVGMISHRLKSSSLTVGAQQFSDLCKYLESFKNGGDENRALEIVGQLRIQLESIENYLERNPYG